MSKRSLETPVCDNTEGVDGHNYFDSDHNMMMMMVIIIIYVCIIGY